ncbi:MAG: O-antigen ligase family protein [Verrucomicrobia bacterium]|nr:O-antigen ligase family protein [Verrucomicrobiota bacterium]
MTRAQLAGWCQWAVLGLIVAILLYGPLAMGAVRAPEFLVIQFATLGVLALWVVRCWLDPECRFHWPPVCWAVLAFVLYAVVRYLQADIEYAARFELVRVLVYAVIFFALLNNATHREAPQVVSFALLAVAMGIAAYGIYQWATESNTVWGFARPAGYAKRGSGTFICPNHLAGFLELLAPLGLAYVVGGRIGHLAKILIAYATLVLLAGIAVTVSRAGWIAAGAGLVVFLLAALREPRYRLPALLLTVALAATAVIFSMRSDYLQRRLEKISDTEWESSGGIRLNIWKAAVKMWQTSPWVGVGPAHFDARFREFRPETVQPRPLYVHNDYLNTLADWGVVGLALVLATVALTGWGVVRSWKFLQRPPNLDFTAKRGERNRQHSNRAAFVLGASAGVFALLVHSFFDFNMQIPANAILAIALLALLASHQRYATERDWWRGGILAKLAFTLAALALIGLGAWEGRRLGREDALLRQANALRETDPNGRRELLKAAFALEPQNPETAHEIGEQYRLDAWQGGDDYAALAVKAMEWFHCSRELNPYGPLNNLRIGMCLHWLGKHEEAKPFFDRAEHLDPNGYFMLAHLGWHQMQLGNFARARPYLERSRHLTPYLTENTLADTYLGILERQATAPPFPTPPVVEPKK